MEVFVENFHKIVNCFKIVEVVVTHIHTDAKVEASISSIDNFEISELDKVCMFGISHRHN